MKREVMLKNLTKWIESLKEDAQNDNSYSIAWFGDTKNEPFSIIAGWEADFSPDYSDHICVSKSNPDYALCIKIAVNDGPYAYTDFEIMNMPITEDGEVDDTCIVLEYDDDAEKLAEYFLGEWEKITNEYSEECEEGDQ